MRRFSLALLTVAGVVGVLVAVLTTGRPVGELLPAASRDLPVTTPSGEPATSRSISDDETPTPEATPTVPRRGVPAASQPGSRALPLEIKAIYLTSWSAATPSRITQAIDLIGQTELNAVVIDIKDYRGKVVFKTSSPVIAAVQSEEQRLDLAGLVRRLHEKNIYVIARIAVFQDQHLVTVRPDLAVRDPAGRVWRGRNRLAWVDPASPEVWAYIVAVAREAAWAGVDEVNFDYVRFPTDGNLSAIRYPVFDPRTQTRRQVLQQFFAYLGEELRTAGAVRSADLFGLATVRDDDLGIGQVLEDALLHFDVVAPMVYPSHYARGFLGYRNPAAHPYEVVHYSLTRAAARRERLARTLSALAKDGRDDDAAITVGSIRPWLQAFDLGAAYPPAAIRRQMQAVGDAGLSAGWLLWSPANRYLAASFQGE